VTDKEVLPPEFQKLIEDERVYESKGCPACRNSGYQGRTAIFEMFSLDDAIRQLILRQAHANQIREKARGLGMRTLAESGLEKVKLGLTSIAEVYRVARDETVDMRILMQNGN